MNGHGGSWARDFIVDELYKTLDEVYDDRSIEELGRKFCALATLNMDMSGVCFLIVLLYDKRNPFELSVTSI
ncbi:hypothetical protein DD237_005359 [Peronospora effusa]|uniref:Uncharacterized protein n=1 Tax=Peronospora effusa TaxID=542832 RepID=A0A3R7WQX2_9STRA|nr:hypothetical protein DD237_005359 [Peronospora effusa]